MRTLYLWTACPMGIDEDELNEKLNDNFAGVVPIPGMDEWVLVELRFPISEKRGAPEGFILPRDVQFFMKAKIGDRK